MVLYQSTFRFLKEIYKGDTENKSDSITESQLSLP